MYISIDTGFGDCKIAISKDLSQTPTFFKHINAIASLGREQTQVDNPNIVELNGEYYMIGKSATQTATSQVLPIKDYETLKFATPLIIKCYLNQYKDEVLDGIVIGLSLAFVNQSLDYKKYLIDTLNLEESKVFLVPQGVGCKIALDKVGFDVEDASLKIPCNNYLGIDIGFNTIDVIKVIDGVLVKKNIQGYPDTGVTRIVEGVREDLKELGCVEELSDSKIKLFMAQRFAQIRGIRYDLSESLNKRIPEYINFVHEFLEKNYKDDLNNIDFLVLFGGGANLVGKYKDIWNKYYSESFVKIPTNPEYYNAIGGVYYPSLKK